MFRFRFFLLWVALSAVLANLPSHAEIRSRPKAYNEVAVDFPADGGGTLMLSRMWMIGRYLDAGFVGGVGQIDRKFDIEAWGSSNLSAETKALVLPFFGPRLSANFHFVGVSLGYAFFWAGPSWM